MISFRCFFSLSFILGYALAVWSLRPNWESRGPGGRTFDPYRDRSKLPIVGIKASPAVLRLKTVAQLAVPSTCRANSSRRNQVKTEVKTTAGALATTDQPIAWQQRCFTRFSIAKAHFRPTMPKSIIYSIASLEKDIAMAAK